MDNLKRRIMVVDDQPTNLKIIENIVEDDFDFYLASSGEECLENLSPFNPDLVLLDIMMPGMDGYEVCQNIKENDEWKNIQVIFVSALDSMEDRLKGYEYGAADYFVKPFEPDELLVKIQKTLDYISELKNKDESAQYASQIAMKAMTNASELGSILRFMQESFLVSDYKKLAQLILGVVTQFGLNCSLQIRAGDDVITYNSDGAASPLEEHILMAAKNKGRIYDSKDITIYNYDVISLLINNMPLDDEARYGEIKDLACYLLDGAEARILGLLAEKELTKQKMYLMHIVEYANKTIENLNADMHTLRVNGATIVEDMKEQLENIVPLLELEEDQENSIFNVTDSGIEKTTELFRKGIKMDEEFTSIINKLTTSLNSDTNTEQSLDNVFKTII